MKSKAADCGLISTEISGIVLLCVSSIVIMIIIIIIIIIIAIIIIVIKLFWDLILHIFSSSKVTKMNK